MKKYSKKVDGWISGYILNYQYRKNEWLILIKKKEEKKAPLITTCFDSNSSKQSIFVRTILRERKG